MKKQFGILVVIGAVIGLVGMSMVFQTVSAKNVQSGYNQAVKPIPAANMQIVKKTFLPPEFGETRGKPSSPPPGKDKNKDEGTATGKLGAEATGNKYAIIIGICDYPGTGSDLCASDGDSLNMYKALTELYGYTDENIYLFRDTNPIIAENMPTDGAATFSNIYTAIANLATTTVSNDEIVFFFSGHGGRLRDEYGNPIDVAPVDEADGADEVIAVHNGSEAVGISDDMLVDWFSGFQTSRITFIFDTCLAGGMNDLADDEPSDNGRIVVMATDETHSAYVYSTGTYDIDGDGVKDGEGVFSHFFVNEGILQGLADKYDHGIDDGNIQTLGEDVVIEEAFDYGKNNIPGRLKRWQKPVINDGFNDDLLL